LRRDIEEVMKNMSVAFVALGSNLGDSRRTLARSIDDLRKLSERAILVSSLWESAPVDCPPGSAMFVNAVVGLTPKPDETPESLLAKLQAMEKEAGRRPKKIMNEPRPLDLDLIAFGNEIRSMPQLTLPHPRAHQRRFVLEPLNEIAPELALPGQSKTVAELVRELPPGQDVKRLPGEAPS
jgi:2-amino-4-hydroxy-6-hydroxymethyldihydropteridine diphosphokinase